MAGRRKLSTVEDTVDISTVEPTEVGVEVEGTEVVESTEEIASSEGLEAAFHDTKDGLKEPKAPPLPVNIDAFLAILNEGLAKKDESTGQLDVATISDVLKAYRELPDAKSKAKARTHVNDGMREAVDETDMASARAYMILSKELSSSPTRATGEKTPRAPKEPADPTKAFVDEAVRLRLAMQVHSNGLSDLIKDDWKDQVTSKFDELRPQLDTYQNFLDSEDVENIEVPEVDPLVIKAFKTAAGKSAGGSGPRASALSQAVGDGVRRNVGVHMTEAFADKPVGTFMTIAQIRSFKSSEYGDTPPSAGALTARLFPKDKDGVIKSTTVEGLEGAEDEVGHKGAKKVA